jgi:exosortase
VVDNHTENVREFHFAASDSRPRPTAALALSLALGAGVLALYAEVVARLVQHWWTVPDYSHGLVVAPLVAWLVWRRRDQLTSTPRSPCGAGLLVTAGAIILLLVGTLGAELFLTRVSLLMYTAGAVLFLFGRRQLRTLAFPLALVLLTIPIPAIVVSRLTLSLQLTASALTEALLTAAGVPVLREGNVLVLSSATLQVADACSGIRSLMALLTLGVIVAREGSRRWPGRAMVIASTFPIAVVVNAARVTASAIGVHLYGEAAVEGFAHDMVGWLAFCGALGLLTLCARAIPAVSARLWRVTA